MKTIQSTHLIFLASFLGWGWGNDSREMEKIQRERYLHYEPEIKHRKYTRKADLLKRSNSPAYG